MVDRCPGFTGEFLWEFEIAEHHLTALAAAVPADRYGWRPVEGARTVSGVFVHIATGNFALLDMIGVSAAPDLYASLPGEGFQRFLSLIVRNHALEGSVTDKEGVTAMLASSLSAARTAFTRASAEELDVVGEFFGERTTVRRVYLRMLAHMHEHMGQLIAYVRAMGLPAPWPDPMDEVRTRFAAFESS